MLHLPIHLAEEAIISGPVQFRWIYSGERALYTRKSQVRNRSCPEGSMAEAYMVEDFSRHVGKLVRDLGMLPIRVHGWNEIDPAYLDKLWAAIVV